jgi:SAM-dependent methyltransferase
MTIPLDAALARVRSLLLDPEALVSAVAAGRRRGSAPRWRRAELRYVDLKGGRRLQVTTYDDTQAHTTNAALGRAADEAVDELLAEPFGNWHVETATQVLQLRVTKKLAAALHVQDRAAVVDVARGHDRDKPRLLPADDPVLVALGISTETGEVKPSRQAKYRQVEDFLRLLDASLSDAGVKGHLRQPTPEEPLRIVDLGCGNAYLTFAAHRFLTETRGLPVRLTGVDTKQQSRDHNRAVAERLGLDVEFVVAGIAEVALDPPPDVVLALHACDTATDDALARAIGWGADLVLAAPCCHHDLARQLRAAPAPAPYTELLRHGILRERLADTLTDALRAALLRDHGYRVDVVEFVESAHTPRNTLIRAVRTNPSARPGAAHEAGDLAAAWSVRPRLAELLDRAAR